MLKNKTKLKKMLLSVCIATICLLVLFLIINICEYNTYKKNYNLKIAELVYNIKVKYPEVSEKEIIEVLNENNNSAINDEIVNEIQNTNEIENTSEIITKETNSISENVILESDKENTQEADIIEKEIVIPKEQKQTNVNVQEKKIDNLKKTEQQKTTQTTTQETITKENTQLQEEKVQEQPKQETKTEPIVKEPEKPKCTETKHGVAVGNSNKWFDSYDSAVNYYDSLIKGYSDKVKSGEISYEEYSSKCRLCCFLLFCFL